jgi:hypothetical protein
MTNPETQMDVLHQLLEERSRYESWLAQLEARRGHTPHHVLERVRSDYSSRLEGVTGQLRGRAVELERSVQGLQARHGALVNEEEQRRDERAETELRAAVGEYSDEHARSAINACDEAIGLLMGQRDVVARELAELQGVLVQIFEAPGATAAATSVLAPVAAVVPTPQPMERVEPAPNAVDELAFLRSVVASPEAVPSVALPAAPAASADLLPPPVLTAPRRPATPLSTAIPTPRAAANPAGGLTPSAVQTFLKDVPAEQVKTLKCAECGTMNLPTEWYCERCGGELAAM